MTTKDALQNRIETLETLVAKKNETIWALEAENKSLKMAVSELPEYEKVPEGAYPAQEHNVWSRNHKIKVAAEIQLQAVMGWASRNCGFGETDDERQATGLAQLMHMHIMGPQMAILFAAEICEEENYHGECAQLHNLLDVMQSPYRRNPHQAQSVNWWAE